MAARGGHALSSRLIIDKQGFVDITDVSETNPGGVLDLNDEGTPYPTQLVVVHMSFPGNGFFRFCVQGELRSGPWRTAKFKPLPDVSDSDAKLISDMISSNYMPYQNIPDEPGKPAEEIKSLGERLFPFSPHSFELAMTIYDWTTPSFTRAVFMTIFTYTGMPPPYPLDLKSIAKEIWSSNLGTFVPSNPDYMRSFMMKPATSLSHGLTDAQNRMLSAAIMSMPRTPVIRAPQLFSGQLDTPHLDLSRFAIELLECPLNMGPSGAELKMPFSAAATSFIEIGKVTTTKVTWSFGDSIDVAMHYQNGLIIIANPPGDSLVWGAAAYITPLSDDPEKNEYTFPPGTSFIVESLEPGVIGNKRVQYLTLKFHDKVL
ncbi:hypothetical protein FRC10_007940 [Ceratobasidium sp. 414]|nr:hypothetical protein FRC10_007940 [Ceratobasidium sp. 414]